MLSKFCFSLCYQSILQVVGTAVLMSSILAVTDPRNNKPIQGMEPFVISLILHGLGLGKF